MDLVDAQGKPLLKTDEGKISCSIVVTDVQKFSTGTIGLNTKQGVQQIPIQHAVQNLLTGLYELMRSTEQKEMIVRIVDNTSSLEVSKNIQIEILQLPKNDTEELIDKGTEV